MRKIALVLMILLLFSVNSMVYADNSVSNNTLSFAYDDEYDDVIRAVLEYDQSIDAIELSDIVYCYKTYSLSKNDLNDINDANDIVTTIISDGYEWRAITSANEVIKLRMSANGTFEVYACTTPQRGTNNFNYYDMNSIISIVDENSQLMNVSDMYVIEMNSIRTTFCLLITSEDQYIIPYGSRPDFTGLENGKCYHVDDVILLLNTYYSEREDNSSIINNIEEMRYGGLNDKNISAELMRKNEWLNCSTLIVLFVVLCGIYIAIRLIRSRQRISR